MASTFSEWETHHRREAMSVTRECLHRIHSGVDMEAVKDICHAASAMEFARANSANVATKDRMLAKLHHHLTCDHETCTKARELHPLALWKQLEQESEAAKASHSMEKEVTANMGQFVLENADLRQRRDYQLPLDLYSALRVSAQSGEERRSVNLAQVRSEIYKLQTRGGKRFRFD